VVSNGVLVVSEDMVIKDLRDIRNCRHLEIYGYVEGDAAAHKVLIHKNGRFYGSIRTDSAEVYGTLQGNVVVKHLIDIKSSGSVSGNVQYGKLAMEVGGNLSAEVRNVPPSIAGDLAVTVERGRTVKLTLQDLNAVDPDDTSKDLIFTVGSARSGFVAMAAAPSKPVTKFTQADLETGKVLFCHDGTRSTAGSFDIVVADRTGASSGRAKTVKVDVVAQRV
jgi:cytoskeletal protein CcmA (bactofilin family)